MNQIMKILSYIEDNAQKTEQFNDMLSQSNSVNPSPDSFSNHIELLLQIYKKNNTIIDETTRICNEAITKEDADELFEKLQKILMSYHNEYRFLLPFVEKLITYYEAENDYEKLPYLYSNANFLNNLALHTREIGTPNDFTYFLRLKDSFIHYDTIQDEMARLIYWKSFEIMMFSSIISEYFTPKQAFAFYDEIMELWNQPSVQSLEVNKVAFTSVIDRIKKNLSYILFSISKEKDVKIINRFYTVSIENYVSQLQVKQNKYELDTIVYTSYLYVLFKRNEITKEELFDQTIELYHYGNDKYAKAKVYTIEASTFYLDITKALSFSFQHDIDSERVSRLLTCFVTLATTNWIIEDETCECYLNELLLRLCGWIIQFSDKQYFELQNFYAKAILQKNPFFYIHTQQIKLISAAIFQEAFHKVPELFGQYAHMSYPELQEFVDLCSIYHDIGCINLFSIIYKKLYKLSDQEKKAFEQHPLIGAKFANSIKNLRPFQTVILGHHKYYDGSGGYPESYDNTNAKNKIIADIIFIANYIGEISDSYLQKNVFKSFDEILEELKQGSGTKFHPDLVEILTSSENLQKQIQTITTTTKFNTIVQFHKTSIESKFVQDIDVLLEDVRITCEEAQKTGNPDLVLPKIEQLLDFAERENSDKIYGYTYYYYMVYYFIKGDSVNVINYGLEALRYQENAKQYRLMASTHTALGMTRINQGNPESAIGHYLEAAECSDLCDYPNGKLISYNNLANIFKRLGVYEKAIHYYDLAKKCSSSEAKFLITVRLNELFCYIQLDDYSSAKECHEEIIAFKNTLTAGKDYYPFTYNVYEACWADYTHDEALLNELFKTISNDLSALSDYSLLFDEILVYIELLEKSERLEELNQQLELYIDYCEQNQITSNMVNIFLYKRTISAQKENDYPSTIKYGMKLKELKDKQLAIESDLILKLEKNYISNLKLQENRREIVNDNKSLQQKIKQEKKAIDAKGSFLSLISKEIKTPIQVILDLNEEMLKRDNPEGITSYATDMKTASNNLLGIVNDIIDYSALESDKAILHLENYNFSVLLSQLQEKYRSKALQKGLSFQWNMQPLCVTELNGDSERVHQIMEQILSNAIKFTNEGTISVSVSQKKKNNLLVEITFIVKDTGIGIHEHELDKLLKPFERADENKNRNIPGSGLGLSIVNLILHKMHGNLEINSVYEQGSEFIIHFLQGISNQTVTAQSLTDNETNIHS